jgi:hypothetical protein
MTPIHAESAKFFTAKAEELENICNEKDFIKIKDQYTAYVCSAMIMSASFLEANINEFFMSYKEPVPMPIMQLAENNQSTEILNATLQSLPTDYMIYLWEKSEIEKSSALDKYNLALIVHKKEPFNQGENPYQNAKLTIMLRNMLLHSKMGKTEIDSDFNPRETNLEKKLRRKFKLNPFSDAKSSFLPHRCLSADCAKWAYESTQNLSEDFFKRIMGK